MSFAWVFNGPGASLPAGVFSSRDIAEHWIAEHGLTGILTAYPIDVGTYDWAVRAGYFTPKRDDQRGAEFIQRFSSASLEHYHYEEGRGDSVGGESPE